VISIRSANARAGVELLVEKFISHRCDGVIANTHAGWALSRVSQVEGLLHWVLPNAVTFDHKAEVKLPSAPPKKLILVMLGNIRIRTKGYDLAVKLVRILQDRKFPFELRVAGRPDELPEFESICSQLGVKDEVRFYGEVSQPEDFLREGHLYLLLSRFEGMPNTLLEALSVGLPAIATDVGDLRLLKENGAPYTLIPTEDTAAAVQAVENALAQWEETRAAAGRGRSWVRENFSEEAGRNMLRTILSEL
jgi:glycosyltransferase involved in cell wall biosynthesis